ncbi:hypothetical protein F511_34215 [Dorcoceras hygrometricum]|uniref:Uncharacterized protein n=1 Tax=Dorcoceras hygrometricum TaxID=472368 RepID=A0A2Z7D072_9LAMI|nr:hypothetical protein F511_34215 [Dorcoceras hygrometricum]
MVAKENKSSWADIDSEESSSGTSSSSESDEEVQFLMANDNDEVFDFSNLEFTRFVRPVASMVWANVGIVEPPGPGDGPTGRAPVVVAGAGRTNENTSWWSRGAQDGWLVTLEPSGPGGGPSGRLRQWWLEHGEQCKNRRLVTAAACAGECILGLGFVLNGSV